MTDDRRDAPYWDIERYRKGATAESATPHQGRQQTLRLGYSGNVAAIFWAALRGAVLSILTVGLHRFWMITRLRRLYWAAIRIDGDPLEYTGRGLEKLMGFLLALVVLAIYLGAVNLGLTYAGLSFAAQDPVMLQLSLQLSVVATLPLIFYAIYRSHRYVLARTRWRGIRFGLGAGAWGYTWRAVLLSLLTLLTLGLAYPYQQFRLAKYMTDRASFGDIPFQQDGSWKELFSQWVWIYIVAGIGGLSIWGLVDNPDDTTAAFLGTVVLAFGGLALLLAYQRYQIAAFRILWDNRSLGEARFANDLSAGRVIGIYVGGGLAVMVIAGIVGALAGFALVSGGYRIVGPEVLQAALASEDPQALWDMWPLLVAGALTYLLFLAFAFALTQVFVTGPVLRVKAEGMTLINPERLALSRQRSHEAAGEAGGFADALGVDIGAGI